MPKFTKDNAAEFGKRGGTKTYARYGTEQELYNLPAPIWLLDNEIVKGEISLLYAPSGMAKTFKAIDYAMRISQDMPVMYIAAEDVHGVSVRVQAYRKYYKTQVNGNFYTWPNELNLMNGDVDTFISQVQALDIGFIVIDTLAMCMIGADENSPKDMGIAVHNIKRIQRALNTAILIVHHTGKDGTVERGHSSLRAAAYMIFSLYEKDDHYILENIKAKNSTRTSPKSLKLEIIDDSAVLIETVTAKNS